MILHNKNFLNLKDFHFKIILFLLITLYISLILFISFVYDINYYQVWKFFGVPAREVLFSDIYPFFVNDFCKINSINTQDYYDQFQNCDAWQRPYNYMPIWIEFLKLGVHQKYYYFFGIAFSLLFYLAFFKLIVINSKKDFFIYALAILSPPVMFGIERGNTDLFIFFLCFIYISLLQRNNIIANIFSYILIFFSALLKFYPIFLVFLFFKKSFWNKIFGIITFLTFLLYVLINYSDILLIKENTPQTFFLSYGYNVLEAGLNNIFYKLNLIFFAAKNYLLGDYESFKGGIFHILYTNEFQNNSFIFSKLFLLFIIFVFIFKNLKISDNKKIPKSHNYSFFILGASIFCGTFVLGANFDYRLIFLLFTFPYLIDLQEDNRNFLFLKNSSFIYLIIIYLWLTPFTIFTSGLDEIITWFIFMFYLEFLIIYYLDVFFKKKS